MILTSAGISSESGLIMFRGQDDLWEEHKIEDTSTTKDYSIDPELV